MKTTTPIVCTALATLIVAGLGFVALAQGQLKTLPPRLTPLPSRTTVPLVEVTGTKPIPLQVGRSITLPTSQLASATNLYTVPNGYRLVIEYISFSITAQVRDDVAVARLRIGTMLNGGTVYHDVSTLGGSRLWLGESQALRLYADPGSTVNAVIEREFRPPSNARVSLSGYLEPMSLSR